jgi:hypothetical protein
LFVCNRKIELPEGINRRITRSFGAQLLRKAQTDCAVTNKVRACALFAAAPAGCSSCVSCSQYSQVCT